MTFYGYDDSIIIQNATLAYQQQIIFEKLNLTFPPRKLTCILGSSGVGKTTLLRLIAGLVTNNKEIYFRGKILGIHFNQIAYMAQKDLLLPWLNAFDNALLGSKLRRKNFSEHHHLAQQLFKEFELEGAQLKFPKQLSGGMRQRVALIRTLLENKKIILMDEPFSSLDALTRFKLQNLAVNFLKDRTVLLVTHDPLEALRLADEIIILTGKPAHVTYRISLTTLTPRNLDNPEVLHYQSILYQSLMGTVT